jgi:MoaA/NifB/PqqE/SkfB family radical SAM enzyme
MTTADAYSPLKALRHLDVLQAVREGRPARPVHVEMILSDLCNHACAFCSFRDPNYSSSQLFRTHEPDSKRGLRHPGLEAFNFNPKRFMPTEKALEILDDCKAMGVGAIQFTGGGEPTLHPDFVQILEAAHAHGFAVSLVTNGVKLGDRSTQAATDAVRRAAWLRVSLDAATAETYTRIRRCPDWHFEAACNAVREFAGSPGRVVGVGFVVTPDNWREIFDGAKLARELGADNIRIGAQFSAEDERLFAGFHAEAAALAREAEALTRPGFTVVNRFSEKLDDLRQRAPDYDRCGYQQFTTFIGADCNVYRCCVQAYNERGIVGSVKDRRFRDLWLSDERAESMAMFKASDCDRCQFNRINSVINYATSADAPLHSEFV